MKPFNLISGDHDLTLTEQLSIFRARQGWTTEELGLRLGLTARSVSLITSGTQQPTGKTLQLLYVLKDNPNYFDDLLGLTKE